MSGSGAESKVQSTIPMCPHSPLTALVTVYYGGHQAFIPKRRRHVHVQRLGARLDEAATDDNAYLHYLRAAQEPGRLDENLAQIRLNLLDL